MKSWITFCLILLTSPGFGAAEPKSSIVVFAAASLTNVLQDVGANFTRETSIDVLFSFAASSALARQIENGAPADVFFSADVEWMDYLQTRNLILATSRHDLVGNQLVLVAPANSTLEIKIAPNFPLARILGKGRLATGDPEGVPVGRYARQALMSLNVWSSVQDHLVRADSVRSALAFVDRDEVGLGIVYATDALIDKKVRVVDIFPEHTHRPITYPIALTSSAHAQSVQFLDYLRGAIGDAAFKKYGFTPLHK